MFFQRSHNVQRGRWKTPLYGRFTPTAAFFSPRTSPVSSAQDCGRGRFKDQTTPTLSSTSTMYVDLTPPTAQGSAYGVGHRLSKPSVMYSFDASSWLHLSKTRFNAYTELLCMLSNCTGYKITHTCL